MTTYVARHSIAMFFSRAADKLYAGARALDVRLAARIKAADDRRALAAMSARQLRDIGLDVRQTDVPARPRLGDWPL